MTDSNRTRVQNRQRFLRNKNAFEEIFGDPFTQPDGVMGQYEALKAKSSLIVALSTLEDNTATPNPARPNLIDFFCDVERIASIALKDEEMERKFFETYLSQTTKKAFTHDERIKLEQRIGQLLLAYGISPVSRYFRTVRKPLQRKSL